MGKRIVEIDVTSGVLIIKIILAHLCSFLSLHFILDDVLFFCSPWLAFKAGMFFKMKDVWHVQIRKDIKRLFIPFLCFGLIGIFFTYSVYLLGVQIVPSTFSSNVKSLFWLGTFPNSHHLWYLLTLFFAKSLMNIIYGKVNHYIVATSACCLVCLLTFLNCNSPLFVFNTLDILFFFVLGFLLKDNQYEKKVCMTAFIVLLLIIFLKPTRLDIFQNIVLYGWYPLWYPYSLAGIICLNNLARWLYQKIQLPDCCKFLSKAFSYVGKNSMFFYAAQGVLLKSGLFLGRYLRLPNTALMMVFVIFFTILSYIVLDRLLNLVPRFRHFIIGK